MNPRRINRKKHKTQSQKIKPRKLATQNPPITDNKLNMESTWKVASRPYESRNKQTASSPKPKKQQGTQTAKVESRNFPVAESRNLKISRKRKPKNLQKPNQTRKPSIME